MLLLCSVFSVLGSSVLGSWFSSGLDLDHERHDDDRAGAAKLAPELIAARLRERVRDRQLHAFQQYDSELSENRLKAVKHSLADNGMHILFPFFTQREINRVRNVLSKYHSAHSPEQRKMAHADIATHIPQVMHTLNNENLSRLLAALDPSYVLRKVCYTPRQSKAKGEETWR